MRRTAGVTLLILGLLWTAAPLYAQNIFIEPYNLHNFLFTIDNLFQQHLTKPENNLIGNADLIDEYLEWLGLNSAKTTRLEMGKPHNEVFNALYNKPKVDEKKLIREAWKKAFGIDVWYPYYKYKEIEDWVKERLSVKVFNLKGKPKFSRNHIFYVFKSKF